MMAHPKQFLHIWVAFDIDRVEIDDSLFLELVGVGIHVKVGSKTSISIDHTSRLIILPSEDKPPPFPCIEISIYHKVEVSFFSRSIT